jgi:kynurenine formamidase
MAIDLDAADLTGARGHAVLIRTDHSRRWDTDAYFVEHPHLTAHAADVLVAAGVACVGIDSLNIDAIDGTGRPVHTILLGAEIPIVEHLTRLDRLPESGFRFTAVPPKISGAGTFTVRAYATIDE